MKKWKQRLFSLLLCGAMLVSLCVPVEAADVVDSGRFPGVGGNVPWGWELDSDGRLTITPDPVAIVPLPMPDFGQ